MINFDIRLLKCNNKDKINSELYNSYYFLVYNICRKYLKDVEESKDLSHDIFIKLTKNIDKFDSEHIAQLTSWIKVFSKNSAIDYLRKKDTVTQNLKDYEFIDIVEIDVVSLFEDKYQNLSNLISKSIDKLSPRARTAIKMFYFEDKTHEEIAQELEINVGTSKSNLHKAKLRLADLLKNYKNEI